MSHSLTGDLDRLASGETLTQEGARDLMLAIMGGEASEAQSPPSLWRCASAGRRSPKFPAPPSHAILATTVGRL